MPRRVRRGDRACCRPTGGGAEPSQFDRGAHSVRLLPRMRIPREPGRIVGAALSLEALAVRALRDTAAMKGTELRCRLLIARLRTSRGVVPALQQQDDAVEIASVVRPTGPGRSHEAPSSPLTSRPPAGRGEFSALLPDFSPRTFGGERDSPCDVRTSPRTSTTPGGAVTLPRAPRADGGQPPIPPRPGPPPRPAQGVQTPETGTFAPHARRGGVRRRRRTGATGGGSEPSAPGSPRTREPRRSGQLRAARADELDDLRRRGGDRAAGERAAAGRTRCRAGSPGRSCRRRAWRPG